MTNPERRIAVGVDELPPWDDEDALDQDEQSIRGADRGDLAVYGFDSDQRTLVGLGPVERARRSREAAEAPESRRMPQSEPPGPFIAEDDEQPPSWRKRKLSGWTIALPAALLVAAAALVIVRARAPQSPVPSQLAGAEAPRMPAGDTPRLEDVKASRSEVSLGAPSDEPAVGAARNESEPEPPAAPPESATAANAPIDVTALPVKLPELPPPTIVDRSSSTDTKIGIINVTSSPPSNVVLDGRPLGKAPRVVRVPAGIHTVVFIHPLYGRRSLSVNVRPGATTGASADF